MLERDASSNTGGFKLTETTGWSDVFYRTNFYKIATAEMLRVISIPRGDQEDQVEGNKEFRKHCQDNPNLDRFFLYEAYKALLRKKPKGQSSGPEASSSTKDVQRDNPDTGPSQPPEREPTVTSSFSKEQTPSQSDPPPPPSDQPPHPAPGPEVPSASDTGEGSRRQCLEEIRIRFG
jgi:hypothetical protein